MDMNMANRVASDLNQLSAKVKNLKSKRKETAKTTTAPNKPTIYSHNRDFWHSSFDFSAHISARSCKARRHIPVHPLSLTSSRYSATPARERPPSFQGPFLPDMAI